MKFNCEDTAYYKQAKEKESKEEEWPPRFVKFLWKCDPEKVDGVERSAMEVAFVDPRRLGRIRLVDCEADNIRNESPLKENGPDPVRDKDTVTVEWLTELLRRKRVPVKALLLDQGNISGIGNWVADEVLYQACIHPEQYSNTFNDAQIKQLHEALIGVCTFAVECLADSKQFPEHWLMKYRWDKGKKDSNVLPTGEKIVHLTVGGRTSAIVPSRQMKTAAVAGDVDAKEMKDGDQKKATKGGKRKLATGGAASEGEEEKSANTRKRRVKDSETEGVAEEAETAKKSRGGKAARSSGVKKEGGEDQARGGADDDNEAKVERKQPKKSGSKSSAAKKNKSPPSESPAVSGTRRSTRVKA